MEQAMFGAGCFWGVEETFRQIDGVVETAVGYAGGTVDDPDYRRVCGGDTGHAEVVHVRFDPAQVSYEQLLEVFWSIHDPTQQNRQGPDLGSQYRSAIFHYGPEQEMAARGAVDALTDAGRFRRPIATEIAPAPTFWRAEEYHQQYIAKGGRSACSR